MLNSEFGVVNTILNDLIGCGAALDDRSLLGAGRHPARQPVARLSLHDARHQRRTAIHPIGHLRSRDRSTAPAGWQRFRRITLPLLLVAVGPLLIASYVYNFNNFNLIYLFIAGGPPIPGASTQAGYTDILISYVYNLAFESGGRGVQYGLASAISIVVFFIVGCHHTVPVPLHEHVGGGKRKCLTWPKPTKASADHRRNSRRRSALPSAWSSRCSADHLLPSSRCFGSSPPRLISSNSLATQSLLIPGTCGLKNYQTLVQPGSGLTSSAT
ncbi:MAG: hypothetical protein MZV65_36080 [Chromatiales bacterium]|nr:hypothetical protein [Chromatiales bacterium]